MSNNIIYWPVGPNNTFSIYFSYKIPLYDKLLFLGKWFYCDLRENYIEYICLKEVDNETRLNLYDEQFNPVLIFVAKYGNEFKMKAQICSIDDSSYGIWWESVKSIDQYLLTIERLKKFIDEQKLLNGHYFINFCINNLNADLKTIDYN